MKKLNDLLVRIPEIQARAKQRTEREPLPGKPLPKNVVQLPLWPEPVRAVPNGFLRSALFGAIGKGKRRYMQGELVAAVDGVEIRYTGQRLDQGDLDVWESVLHAVRLQELGGQCRVTSYAFLKLMGKTDTGSNRATLQTRIERLRANALTVKQGRYSYIGGLIAGAAKDEDTQEWVIELDAKMRPLFAADQFTQIEWAVRHALNGQPLAQWLHGFYATHAKPFPMKVETLLSLSGSENTEPRSSRQKLRKALDALTDASATYGEGFGYDIRGDLVHVQKRASGPQRRHLAKLASKPRKPRG
ncbi:plasmid replication initiator TrfA [Massilia sp. DJPM01]|uniref:plasmid replication initiator TrfA n=1 Tax=Massilia sp. DJPM01 TaxID=3024404 RepID=UPI00259E0C19|nr:plasmid replication initiator TrfA [Massilia sp. DJPM01]MDM5182029.1 plasmid replication initiator TrfA [Massilia sp. DJPM01]